METNALDRVVTAMPESLGRLRIPYLYQYWRRMSAAGAGPREDSGEWDLENTLLAGLAINVLEAVKFFSSGRPSFDDLERWILATSGEALTDAELERLRDALDGRDVRSAAGCLDNVAGLTAEDLEFWNENGYVVLHDAVDVADRDAAAAAVYAMVDAAPDDPESWCRDKFGRTIWIPVLRHPAFVANRKASRVVKAFAQLWGREDLWPLIDQGGFNPPEREGWRFPGPHVHWDMTLAPPHRFGVQGILYLTDTPADQGAFSCIPGFHRCLEQWLRELPVGTNPREAIRSYAEMTLIAGKAGDLVIWHHALPHGSSPNRGRLPRVVQYMTLRPTRWAYTGEWV